MILPAQELLVMIDGKRNADLMTGGAKFRRAMKPFQEGFFVEIRLGFHQLIVDPLQDGIIAVRKRVMQRLLDRVVRVAGGAVDVRDGVTNGAGDAGMSRRMVDLVEVLVVELAGEKGHGIMTAGAPARRPNFTVTLEGYFSSFIDAEFIRWIVE